MALKLPIHMPSSKESEITQVLYACWPPAASMFICNHDTMLHTQSK